MSTKLGNHLARIDTGRLFIRHQTAQATWPSRAAPRQAAMIVGVVELPRAMDMERLHDVRLNSSLWMDVDNARRIRDESSGQNYGEEDATGLLRRLQFADTLLPDALEMFVRRTMLEHEENHLQWAYVIGVALHPLPFAQRDGLYELDRFSAPKLIDANPFTGESISGVLRAPLWGPGGRYGLATSMEPDTYRRWIEQERARNMERDKDFAAFVEQQRASNPDLFDLMVYTAEQDAQRSQASDVIVRSLVAQRRMCEMQDLAEAIRADQKIGHAGLATQDTEEDAQSAIRQCGPRQRG
jgi:hypothetical protein